MQWMDNHWEQVEFFFCLNRIKMAYFFRWVLQVMLSVEMIVI
jgi:hypothetical protein